MGVSKRRKANRITPRAIRKGMNKLLVAVVVIIVTLFQILIAEISLPFEPDVKSSTWFLTMKADPKKEMDIKIFIGIKTSVRGVHGDRLPQIQKTWVQDVVTRSEVDLKFFADVSQEAAALIDLNGTDSLSSWIIRTPTCESSGTRLALCCKNELMFRYFLEHYVTSSSDSPFSPWFCAFDDDSYVQIDNLIQVLRSYQRQNATKLYIGRPSSPNGFFWPTLNYSVHFLNGGAGYCISKDLMEFGRDRFSNFLEHCASINLPEDMAMGYLVNHQLGVQQRFDEHFHSHFEKNYWWPQDEISNQVSFAYNNKISRAKAVLHFPNIPILYAVEEDPMLFRSLRAFLFKEKSTKL